MSIKRYKNFKEQPGGLDVGFAADGLFGGPLIGVRGQGGLSLYDWDNGALVRRIEVDPRMVNGLIPSRHTKLTAAGLLE